MSRNASPTNFGFEYQINVAIYFMFWYLKDILTIRVEGEKEDVEIQLKDKKKLMIQAKSQAIDLSDTTNLNRNLKSALTGLSESDNSDVQFLFYACNSIDPLNSKKNDFDEPGVGIKKYKELNNDSKNAIDSQVESILNAKGEEYNIDREKLVIIRIPFFGDFGDQRYKYIISKEKEKLSLMSENLVNRANTIRQYWESKFLDNSSSNPKITIKKDEICNCIILTELDNYDFSKVYENLEIDETAFDEAYSEFKRIIDKRVNKYENITKVYSLYLMSTKNKKISISNFVIQEKIKLYNYFFEKNANSLDEISASEKSNLYVSQIIAYAILRKKSIIEKIEEEVGA